MLKEKIYHCRLQHLAIMESKMLFSKLPIFLALFILFSVSLTPAFAAKQSYIVYMGAHSHGRKMTEATLNEVSDSHYEFLGSFLGSTNEAKEAILYSYRRYINGFAAILDEEQAAKISKDSNVVSVFLNGRKKLHTTHSWSFLSLENSNGDVDSNSLWKKARFGEDIIIGNIDGGIWPESESFSDEGYGPVPSKWNGICQNNTKNGFPCNKKLIGVRYFYKGFTSACGIKDHSNFTARDFDGHGSHTLSIAGGNFVPGANVFGNGNGTAKGGAPRARVAAYKVCWPKFSGVSECSDADILKAFDHAIHDGVDVLSVSLGSPPNDYFNDSISIGSFHAAKHGIAVVASAGNEGPDYASVTNVSPWMLTVAASTMDRELGSYVDLSNGMRLKGKDICKPLPEDRFYPLITGAQAKLANTSASDALSCNEGTLDPQKAKGKILVCLLGESAVKFNKGRQASLAGAVGVILCDNKTTGREIDDDVHVLTASYINYTDCLAVLAYINSTNNPLATIKPMVELHTKPAPFMAEFSSRGPNVITPEILKPDITAPGVHILAAYTGAKGPTEAYFDQRRTPFMTMSGTSMSCPHVAGIVGLLKAIHPDWSPAMIRSAIMTTARTRDNTRHPMLDGSRNGSFVKATPFAYGAGHIRPTLAADPGLVYDLKVKDYKDFLCALGYNKTIIELFSKSHVCSKSTNPLSILNLNYPSITVPKLSVSIIVSRTVKNVGSASTYTVRVRRPPGFLVTVEPNILNFKRTGEEKTFNLTLKAKKTKRSGVSNGYAFGELLWSDGVHNVRSPITVATDATPQPKRTIIPQGVMC